ncbi:MAG TPA: hypothetical protein VKU90_07285 [Caulobacteraceae bacterium]|nr:hypothetical protein [Caulobacteraceae bacterium]
MAEANPNRFDFGAAISGTFAAFAQNWALYIGLAALFVTLPTLLAGWGLMLLTQSDPTADLRAADLIDTYAKAAVASIGSGAVRGAVIYGAGAHFAGRRASASQCLSTGMREWFPLFGQSWLAGLAIGAASLALIVPGIILAMMWYVIGPVRVLERREVTACFGRSADLTRGHRWILFGFAILVSVMTFFVSLLIGFAIGLGIGLTGGAPAFTQMGQLVAVPLAYLLTFPFEAAASASAYNQLAPTGEAEQLAQVFA